MRRGTGIVWPTSALMMMVYFAGVAVGGAPRSQQDPVPPLNASKAAPSYYPVTKAVTEITQEWDKAGANVPPAAPGWRAFFEALTNELNAYSAATDDRARLESLNRVHQLDLALWTTAWSPAIKVRSALDEWLAPRIRIAWAERRLIDFVGAQKVGSPENHKRWLDFVGEDLASSLGAYESARTVQARRSALKKLTGVLASLRQSNRQVPWSYSNELQTAIDSLYNLPNLDVSADVASVAPFLSHDVVTSGPIARGGYVSQVTAGPKTGFGLLPSDEGIAFYNSQIASTFTPITDFQQQLEQDKKGRKVAKLYHFDASSSDTPELTITAVLRPSTGLSLSPSYAHNIGAAFDALPIQGKGLTRGVLAVIGLNRNKLTQVVGKQAYPRIASGVVEGAQEEAAERIPGAEAEENAKLRKVFVGNNTLAIQDFRVTGLSLRSRPANALVGGLIGHKDIPDAIGADMPQPSSLIAPAGGVSVDLHIGSVLSNSVAGLLLSDEVKGVDNVMIVTKAIDPNAPPKDGVTVGKNVEYATFLKSIDEARAANNPKVTAIRIKKPTVAPEFSADERGFLVAVVRDFQMEVPAPPGGVLGGNAKVLRFIIPNAEFVLSFTVKKAAPGQPIELDAKVEDLVYGTNSKVQSIGDDDTKPTTLGPLPANFALLGFKNKLKEVPIKAPLASVKIPGFDIGEVSPLDPSGWMRVVLVPNGQPIKLPAQAPEPIPPGQPISTPTASVGMNVAP